MLFLFLGLLTPLIVSCSNDTRERQQALENVPKLYAEGAVNIELIAEPKLNAWKDMPNSVTILVIQGRGNADVKEILDNKQKLRALFNGAGAKDNLIKVDRYSLMPGQKSTLHIDRAENVEEIALVAGYYPFPGEGHIARFEVPVALSKNHWWGSDWSAKQQPLQVSLTFGHTSIVRISGAENLHTKREENDTRKEK